MRPAAGEPGAPRALGRVRGPGDLVLAGLRRRPRPHRLHARAPAHRGARLARRRRELPQPRARGAGLRAQGRRHLRLPGAGPQRPRARRAQLRVTAVPGAVRRHGRRREPAQGRGEPGHHGGR